MLKSISRNALWLGIGVILGVSLGLVFIWVRNRTGTTHQNDLLTGKQVENSPAIGSDAPNFELQTLDGNSIRLSDLKGMPVLINFWATWCSPCRQEMPAIESRFEANRDHMAMLAVNFDESEEDVQSFTQELNLKFPVLLDPGAKVQDLYRVRGYPTTFFIDSDGIIQIINVGVMSEKQLDGYLDQIGATK